ncbi:MAG: SIMPL domain-containing protein [Paludibacteraceae bacterium]|nr:SIMPL domain-containing protein [Candidatus Colicola coprequi]MCQ2334174.1 SIMPL domain-containing protein [Paludibacteraceae bacterium]
MNNKLFPSVIVAIGIAIAGFMVYLGVHEFAIKDRAVTVKGLSTRDVKADYVVWPLSFSVDGNDLKQLHQTTDETVQTIKAFLKTKGFTDEEMSMGDMNISNNWAGYYDRRPEYHYSINATLVVSTTDVDKVINNQGCQSELLAKGVLLNSYQWNISYQYNGLNELKPEMVEEATTNARAVAQKFADDSRSRLGGIRQASQGQFSIESNDNQPWMKRVRVVTTVDYYLK